MPKFSPEQLTKWKQEINAGPIVASRMKIQRENNEWVGLCPFHEEKTPSFKVWRNEDGVWCYKCFGCGENGNVFQFIQKKDRVSFNRAVEIVLEIAGIEGWKEGEVQEVEETAPAEKKELLTFPAAAYGAAQFLETSEAGKAWLAARGIGMSVARKLRIGFLQSCKDISATHQWRDDGWVLFPTFSDDKKDVVAVKYRSVVGKKETVNDKHVSGILRMLNCATVLYNMGTVDPREDVFIVEGEPDVAVMEQSGFPSVGYPASDYTPTDDEVTRLTRAKRRFLAGDNDKPGKKAMEALGIRMPEGTYKLQWPKGCKDANDALMKACGGDTKKFTALVNQLKVEALEHPLIAEPIMRDASQIKPRKVKWLWYERIPMGKMTIFAGNPDNAKSLATASVAACVSTGKPFSQETEHREPADVLMMIGEDDLDDTVVPRLIAAGADQKRIHFLEGVRTPSGDEVDIGLDENVAVLEQQLQKNPQIKLVVIDPISNYLGKVSMVAEQEARGVLIPLKRLAAKYNVAFLLVMHLNKKNDLDAISRVGGAMAFIGVARCAWMFVRDIDTPEEGEEKKILNTFRMLRIKNNLIVPDKSGLAYSTATTRVKFAEGGEDFVPYVVWGNVVSQSADDALNGAGKLATRRGRPVATGTTPTLQKAIDWLRNALQGGVEIESGALIEDARSAEGITEGILRQAKDALKVRHRRAPGKGKYFWQLSEIHADTKSLEKIDTAPHSSPIEIAGETF